MIDSRRLLSEKFMKDFTWKTTNFYRQNSSAPFIFYWNLLSSRKSLLTLAVRVGLTKLFGSISHDFRAGKFHS